MRLNQHLISHDAFIGYDNSACSRLNRWFSFPTLRFIVSLFDTFTENVRDYFCLLYTN